MTSSRIIACALLGVAIGAGCGRIGFDARDVGSDLPDREIGADAIGDSAVETVQSESGVIDAATLDEAMHDAFDAMDAPLADAGPDLIDARGFDSDERGDGVSSDDAEDAASIDVVDAAAVDSGDAADSGPSCVSLPLFRTKSYVLCRTPLTFVDAQAECETRAMDLVMIDDLAENSFVASVQEPAALGLLPAGTEMWHGVRARIPRRWERVDGRTIWRGDRRGFAVNGFYTHLWGSGGDPLDNDIPACSVFAPLAGDSWIVRLCAETHPFVCESRTPFERCNGLDDDGNAVSDDGTIGPGSAPVCAPGCIGANLGGRDYAFCDAVALPWNAARTNCNAMDMELAFIESAAEEALIAAEVARAGLAGGRWIGATDQLTEGDWYWAHGVESDGSLVLWVAPSTGTSFWTGGAAGAPVSGRHAAWFGGSPADTLPGNDCAMSFGTNWSPVDCAAALEYTCEQR